ncbi:MAG: aminotransferase class I/II-fold pyridoxal phosphate-dependent enzyme, partial [Chthoniobacterales bacterium]|nr:aminotransferase class I/II-fold pyridoxal phosphate-dependent enzyme [Chthoniobacterales bacterium]
SPRTRVLMMNFPTNPTGATMPPDELKKIASLCRKHDLVVLTDEIYSELTYDSQPHYSIAAYEGMRERTIFLHGLSKAYAMTGWRIGFACAPAEIIEAMMKIHQYSILCASIMSQEAAIEALERGESAMIAMRREYELRRNYICRELNAMGFPTCMPKGAFYVFSDIRSSGLDSKTFSLRLLKEKKVAVVPGTAFGQAGEGFVRCSFATSLNLIKLALERISEFRSSLAKAA